MLLVPCNIHDVTLRTILEPINLNPTKGYQLKFFKPKKTFYLEPKNSKESCKPWISDISSYNSHKQSLIRIPQRRKHSRLLYHPYPKHTVTSSIALQICNGSHCCKNCQFHVSPSMKSLTVKAGGSAKSQTSIKDSSSNHLSLKKSTSPQPNFQKTCCSTCCLMEHKQCQIGELLTTGASIG